MSAISKKLPPVGIPVVDPKTGIMNPQWYIWFRLFSNGALVGAGGSGIVVDDSGILYGRTLTAGSTKVDVTNGSGITGNPTVDVNTANLATALNLSGTNTGDQLVFKTISVSGQSDVVADSSTDTLTLVAGSGMTITTNATTDTITLTSSGSGAAGLTRTFAFMGA